VFVYRNDGTGSFAAAAQPALTVGPAWLTELRLPDIDGDGDLDILLSGWSTDSVWENRGDAGFANRSAAVPFAGSASVGATILAAGDLDDDGDIDLLTQQGDGWRVYVQDAPFVFRHDAASQIPYWSMNPLVWSYLPYDMDGDGDLEWSGRTNLARHLHAASLATVGRPYVLQLFAHPGWLATARTATVFLGVDPAPQPLATPAGAFRVGAGAIALPPIVIPAPQGKTTLRVDVPAIPALVGLQLRAQALLGEGGDGPGRFTNFVVDTLGN